MVVEVFQFAVCSAGTVLESVRKQQSGHLDPYIKLDSVFAGLHFGGWMSQLSGCISSSGNHYFGLGVGVVSVENVCICLYLS